MEWIRQTLAITKAHPGQHEIATIFIGRVQSGFLLLDVGRVRNRLWRLLELASFRGPLLRGEIDVDWEIVTHEWMFYAHVLAIGVPPDAWARLREILRIAKPLYFNPELLKVRRLRDPERQIPKLLTFHTYFWPRSSTGAARAATLPAKRLADLANWGTRHTFKEFTFQFGEDTTRKARKDLQSLGDLS